MSFRDIIAPVLLAGLLLVPSLAPAQDSPVPSGLVFTVGDPAAKGAECHVAFGPAVAISAVAFSPPGPGQADGKTLAVGGYQEVLLWDLSRAKLAKRLGAGVFTGRVTSLAFVGEGPQLAAGDGVPGRSGAVRVFDTNTGALLRFLPGPTDTVRCLAVSPDGKLLAAGGAYKEVHVWSLVDARPVRTIEGHDDWVTGVAFSPDGSLLATVSMDKSLQLWKTDTWDRAGRGSSPEPMHGVAFDPGGRSVAAAVGGPTERAVRVWGTNYTRNSRAVATGGGMPLALVWPAKLNRIYAACSDGTLRNLAASGGAGASFHGHTDWVYAVAVSPDGKLLASGSADGTVRLWNVADGKLLATLVQLAPRTDRWLIMTAQGYLATSSPDALTWKTKGLTTPPEKLTETLRSDAAVCKVLAGDKPESPKLD
ncbi:MAG TPA: WD40 repeat domain-containing protein [Planctomycetota bacterium]|nr:WD40 repeat domain-containing protein [Planctomycetota bacterium]